MIKKKRKKERKQYVEVICGFVCSSKYKQERENRFQIVTIPENNVR